MTYIALGDGTYGEVANPDPRRVLTEDELLQEKLDKQQEIEMCDNNIATLEKEKITLQSEIAEIETLLTN